MLPRLPLLIPLPPIKFYFEFVPSLFRALFVSWTVASKTEIYVLVLVT